MAAHSVTQKKSNVKQGFGFVDNRPIQKMKVASSGVIQLKLPADSKLRQLTWQGLRDIFKPGREHINKFKQWQDILNHIISDKFKGESEADVGRYIDENYPGAQSETRAAAAVAVEEAPPTPLSYEPAAHAGAGGPLPSPPIMDESRRSVAAGKQPAEQSRVMEGLAKFKAAGEEVMSRAASPSMAMRTPAIAAPSLAIESSPAASSVGAGGMRRQADKEPQLGHEAASRRTGSCTVVDH